MDKSNDTMYTLKSIVKNIEINRRALIQMLNIKNITFMNFSLYKRPSLLILYIAICMVSSCNKISSSYSSEDESSQTIADASAKVDSNNPIVTTSKSSVKPTLSSIPYDLIGHVVTEGTSNGYYPSDWKYIIEDNDIKHIQIEDVIADDNDQYIAVIRMQLRGNNISDTNNISNYYYDTKIKIRYINHPQNGWTLDFVHSLGMTVVSDGVYDDVIVKRIDPDHKFWYRLNNNGDIPLTVGGRYLDSHDEWCKFLELIPAHSQTRFLTDDIIIDFVIR